EGVAVERQLRVPVVARLRAGLQRRVARALHFARVNRRAGAEALGQSEDGRALARAGVDDVVSDVALRLQHAGDQIDHAGRGGVVATDRDALETRHYASSVMPWNFGPRKVAICFWAAASAAHTRSCS